MSRETFDCDSEFMKLVSRREDVNLTIAALELARDARPGLDFAPTLDWITARGRELAGPLALATDERRMLERLGECLAGRHGLDGTVDHYEEAESSYLNRVVETGRGIPISLSVVYQAVAAHAGVELVGVAAPLHFLLRYESMDGLLFVDPFHAGRVLDRDACIAWLSDLSDMPHASVARSLEPVGPRAILVRMLNNLKRVHLSRGDWRAAWNVQHRLTSLQPSSYVERRDLARIALRANRPGQAVELIECCLKSCPDGETEALRSDLTEARSRLALCN